MGFSVEGKTALVTGANRGIGKAILETLLGAGAKKVYAAVRRPESAQPLVDEHGDRVVPVELDLEKPGTITAAAEAAGDVQLVVNNAGVLRTVGPLDADAADHLRFELDVNLFGLVRLAQAFGPVLKRNGGGAFVQLNSVVSLKTFPQFTTYSASKAASYAYTQGLRDAFADQGTQVLSVHPGPIATEMVAEHDDLTEIAEPPSVVARGIVDKLAAGAFHLFPDAMARQFGEAYAGFAESVVEADLAEGDPA